MSNTYPTIFREVVESARAELVAKINEIERIAKHKLRSFILSKSPKNITYHSTADTDNTPDGASLDKDEDSKDDKESKAADNKEVKVEDNNNNNKTSAVVSNEDTTKEDDTTKEHEESTESHEDEDETIKELLETSKQEYPYNVISDAANDCFSL